MVGAGAGLASHQTLLVQPGKTTISATSFILNFFSEIFILFNIAPHPGCNLEDSTRKLRYKKLLIGVKCNKIKLVTNPN